MTLKWNRGFTLIETMIAMIIIAGGIIIVSNAWSGNFMRIRKSALNQEIVHLLERKMLEIDIQYRQKPNNIPEEDEGDFGSDFPRYRWQIKSREFEMPDLSSLFVGKKDRGADQMTLTLVSQMQEFFRKAIKEVQVTVLVKVGQKEVPYSITTYFVDFDKEFQIPGLGG